MTRTATKVEGVPMQSVRPTTHSKHTPQPHAHYEVGGVPMQSARPTTTHSKHTPQLRTRTRIHTRRVARHAQLHSRRRTCAIGTPCNALTLRGIRMCSRLPCPPWPSAPYPHENTFMLRDKATMWKSPGNRRGRHGETRNDRTRSRRVDV